MGSYGMTSHEVNTTKGMLGQLLEVHYTNYDSYSECYYSHREELGYHLSPGVSLSHGAITVSPSIGVRHHETERVFNLFSSYDPRVKPTTSTIARTIARIDTADQYELRFNDRVPRRRALANFIERIQSFAEDYYCAYSSLEAIEHHLNHVELDIDQIVRGEVSLGFEAGRGLIAAKLLRHPNYESMRDVYDKCVQASFPFPGGKRLVDMHWIPLLAYLDKM